MPTVLDPETIASRLDPAIARGRYGAAIRDHGEGSAEVLEARQDLIEANITASIRKAREGGPPLRPEQVKRLHTLLAESEG